MHLSKCFLYHFCAFSTDELVLIVIRLSQCRSFRLISRAASSYLHRLELIMENLCWQVTGVSMVEQTHSNRLRTRLSIDGVESRPPRIFSFPYSFKSDMP